ncbi:MAG TPA: hypothetical protein VEA99_20345 [Gemmatimonadaceae bacterium]|nr:hypothetical protein [Gemmatimonadaceae bacterium]
MRAPSRALLHLALLGISLVAVPGCGARSAATQTRPSQGSFAVITREEINSRSWSNAHDMISILRPLWMRTRGADNLNGQTTPVQAYLDNTRLAGLSSLAEISTAGLISVEWVDGVEAAARWGLNHSQGAVVLRTNRTR